MSVRRAWGVLALLMLFMLINFADKAVLGLAADEIMRELHLSATQFGTLASAFYLLFSASAVLVGFLGNHLPVRPLLAALALIWAVAQLPILIPATGFGFLLGTRILLGAGEGPGFPLANHAAFSWFPEGKRSVPSAMITVGGALGAVVGGPLIVLAMATMDWRAAFAMLGGLSLLWLAVWLRHGRDGPYEVRAGSVGDGWRVPYRRILTTGTWLGGTFSAFTVMWALALALAWLPLYLQEEAGFSKAAVSVLVALPSLSAVVLVIAAGTAAQRMIRHGISRHVAHGLLGGAVTLLAGVCMLAMTRVTSGALLLVLVAVAFSAGTAQTPLTNTAIASVCPAGQRSGALAISYAIAALSSVLAPFVAGRIIDLAPTRSAGFSLAFDLASGLLLAGGLASMLRIRPDRDAATLHAAFPLTSGTGAHPAGDQIQDRAGAVRGRVVQDGDPADPVA